ncbi:hypothetical protein R70723_20185 [Paenibacillus sp. FSL R7-0273]|uniref:hypothetical protein n=1 Tax=Paenibacillus sp. FSL R7-0273 TaxID=1536772 RepID=UPI0004F5FB8F|nr:hypothetical protein [Paenibacillus sp. FSL R7-0273]AIQ47965.1 hypothetical protein R70723_20185 [Paenibacillus sp. FSL R7-0273]OMF94483.1 hypothetical protein BK144_08110 [Paenibacillus sp. FSL R7-0273]
MSLPKVSFNLLVFMGLCIQYTLMHLFSAGEIIAISTAELVIYMLFTFAGLGTFFSRRRRALAEQGCGSVGLFFTVLWTVSLCSQFRKESYPEALTLINSFGVSAAGLVLLTEIIVLFKV